jgi:hypothetical protein
MKKGSAFAEPFLSLVGRTGFEPVTNGLKVWRAGYLLISANFREALMVRDVGEKRAVECDGALS